MTFQIEPQVAKDIGLGYPLGSDTIFVCCGHFERFCEEEDFLPSEIGEEYGFEYCPFCGYKISALS